jgi:tRNA pseudouridine38-40 synthase
VGRSAPLPQREAETTLPSSGKPAFHRLALGVAYRGQAYQGWQSQPSGLTVQDHLERALREFAAEPVKTVCAGRTDAGVHALNQVVHFDTPLSRDVFSWVRGTNRYLPADIAVQWCQPVAGDFHARNAALGRRYRYVLLQSAVRPALESGLVGWTFRALDGEAMRLGSRHLLGEHDFTSFRAAACQSPTPVKTLRNIEISQRGPYWSFVFDGNAFLHHMVRNIVGTLLVVGSGRAAPDWVAQVLAARNRDAAAPTFGPEGLYFMGPYYDVRHDIPQTTAAHHWLP